MLKADLQIGERVEQRLHGRPERIHSGYGMACIRDIDEYDILRVAGTKPIEIAAIDCVDILSLQSDRLIARHDEVSASESSHPIWRIIVVESQ